MNNNNLASYTPTTDPLINTSQTGSTHIQYEDIPAPFPSWKKIHNGLGWYWDSPVPCPTDGKPYYWDEDNLQWIEFIE